MPVTLYNLQALGQPSMGHIWDVLIRHALVDVDTANFRAQTMSIPDDTSEVVEILHGMHNLYFAGRDGSSNEITMNFWDTENLQLFRSLNAWRRAILNKLTGTQVSKELYSGVVDMRLLGSSNTVSGKWQLINAWPSSISEVALDRQSSEKISIDVTFKYDLVNRLV